METELCLAASRQSASLLGSAAHCHFASGLSCQAGQPGQHGVHFLELAMLELGSRHAVGCGFAPVM